MEPSVARLLLLFPLVALPVQLCEIPRGSSSLIRSLDLKLLRLTEDLSKEPNPSVYVALRLSNEHSLEREVQYLQRLENAFQRTPSSSSVPADQQEQPKTGLLALHLLALRAACQDMENRKGWRLVTQLKHQLHKEKKQIDRESSGRPITNYYQYSLGVLALCVHGKKIDAHVLHKLLNAEKNHRFMHNVKLSVDTEAMAGLAFACLAQTTFYTSDLVAEISLALQRVKEKILQAQTPEGAFGNIFSSPLAVQLLIATGMSTKKPECLKGMAAILGSLEQGQFQNPMIVSQLLPVLHGKSYVDLGTMQCQGEKDTLVLGTSSPSSGTVSLGAGMITIHLIVKRPPSREKLYKQTISVPYSSSLLAVLEAAEKRSPGQFTFEVQNTLHGPKLTAVMGMKAQEGERRYWQILRAPDISLDQGIADYTPQDRESIVLKFSPW